jgi:hypothetical protein
MTAERAPIADRWVGCVVGSETGVALVLTDRGQVRASYGAGMLARIARDRSAAPAPGDWVVLRRWPDGRITLEAPMCSAPARDARVIPLRAPRHRAAGRGPRHDAR